MESLLAGLAHYGAWFVGGNVLLQQLGLPMPAVPTMVVAGALAADGQARTASPCSPLPSPRRSSPISCGSTPGGATAIRCCGCCAAISLSPDTCVRETEGIFERWGFFSVVLSKFVPGFSTVGPPIAGALRMPVGALHRRIDCERGVVGRARRSSSARVRGADRLRARMDDAMHRSPRRCGSSPRSRSTSASRRSQRWRLARYVHSARITSTSCASALGGDDPPFVVDVGSTLAHQSRPHIPARC